MFPFNMPTRQRLCRILGDEHREKNRTSHLITSVTKVFESPKHNMEIQRPAVPMSRTGLRPTWSDKRDHCMTNRASVAKNMDSWPHYWKSREGSRDAWFRTYNQTSVISDLSLIPSCDVQLTDELQWVKSRLERNPLIKNSCLPGLCTGKYFGTRLAPRSGARAEFLFAALVGVWVSSCISRLAEIIDMFPR